MATNYPGSLDTSSEQPSPLASTEMDDAGFEHDVVHTNHSGAIIALETKVGTGSSTAVADSVLAGTGSGTSGWSTAPSLAGLTVDTDTLYVDATNDRVGIGTTSPGEALDVDGNVMISADQSYYINSATSGVGRLRLHWAQSTGHAYVDYKDDLNFRANGTGGAVTFKSDGKVGIGTTSPSYPLSFGAPADGSQQIALYESGLAGYGIGTDQNRVTIFAGNSGTYVERMVIRGDTGYVGIGTESPGANLDVKRTGSGSWQRGIRVLNADMVNGNELMIATGRADSARNMGQMYFAYTSSGSTSNRLSFGLHSADDVLNITGASRVGIGTTAPSHTLHVNGTFRASGNVVAMYEFHDNVSDRFVNTNTTLYTETITTQGNTRLIMQFVSGQFIKGTTTTNLNIRWSMDGFYLTAGSEYLETQHIGYGNSAMREQLVATANTGTLSAGNHTLRVFAESYGNNIIVMNYQSAARSSHVYVWEVCV